MEIVVTDWMLDSQTRLIENYALSKKEYEGILLPDVKLLKEYPHREEFKNKKFWGPAKIDTQIIKHGFKMKWHNMGNGKVQLRLAIALLDNKAFLCKLYVKTNDKVDKKEMLIFKTKIQKISEGSFFKRGIL